MSEKGFRMGFEEVPEELQRDLLAVLPATHLKNGFIASSRIADENRKEVLKRLHEADLLKHYASNGQYALIAPLRHLVPLAEELNKIYGSKDIPEPIINIAGTSYDMSTHTDAEIWDFFTESSTELGSKGRSYIHQRIEGFIEWRKSQPKPEASDEVELEPSLDISTPPSDDASSSHKEEPGDEEGAEDEPSEEATPEEEVLPPIIDVEPLSEPDPSSEVAPISFTKLDEETLELINKLDTVIASIKLDEDTQSCALTLRSFLQLLLEDKLKGDLEFEVEFRSDFGFKTEATATISLQPKTR